ncbi:HNH endonuclease signature motif containing protein [Actinomycetospora atypica]|uniref:HNH endonuclease signature motif containing protein n=1 Tax=Actinomycetospora atypica TaxID=1290095 RepID=A0ABV9YEN7_9PSEU
MRNSPYRDGQIFHRSDGKWMLTYHQEGLGEQDRVKEFANRGIRRCLDDDVPVGVLIEQEKKGRKSSYLVKGLATVDDWVGDHLALSAAVTNGEPSERTRTFQDILTADAEISSQSSVVEIPDDYDARLRVERTIVARRGQANFRSEQISSLDGACVISGCEVRAVLDAAHIMPYKGTASNVVSNGLLLRTDLHTLLDRDLLAIHPQTGEVHIAQSLQTTEYGGFVGMTALSGHNLEVRRKALEIAWDRYRRMTGL